jgi:hypothetical protein
LKPKILPIARAVELSFVSVHRMRYQPSVMVDAAQSADELAEEIGRWGVTRKERKMRFFSYQAQLSKSIKGSIFLSCRKLSRAPAEFAKKPSLFGFASLETRENGGSIRVSFARFKVLTVSAPWRNLHRK